jgi:alpha-beta hydrolase superfamily lysophospholipase
MTEKSPSKPAWGRRFRRVAALGAFAYAAWCVTVYAAQSRLLFMASVAGPGLSDAIIEAEPGLERHWIPNADGGRTEAWLVRAPVADAKGLVCFLHGNAELIDDALHEAREWNARGFDVLLPEYRGYGRTPGSPSQAAIVHDVVGAVEFIMTKGEPDRRYEGLILHGRSLGTGVAAQVAVGQGGRLKAMVLESPFLSVASFAWSYGVPPALVTNPFRTDEALPRIDAPVLILHARGDEIVPISHGRELATASGATLVELDGSHNSGLSHQREYWRAIDEHVLAR